MTRHDQQDEWPSVGGLVFRLLAPAGDVTPREQVADLAPALGEYIEQGLDPRTRELVTVSVLGGCDPRFACHAAGVVRSAS
jgi:alkylhydroperoxidase/carboxymuconolactone decarboxylase family protein YurZ